MGVSDGVVVGITKIVDHGADGVHWNLVITGDGYTAAQQSDFQDNAQEFVDTLRSVPPFDDLWDDLNVHRLSVECNASGAVNPPVCDDGTAPFAGSASEVVTYYEAQYCSLATTAPNSGLRRLLTVNRAMVFDQTLENATSPGYFPNWDAVVIIVNHVEPGGSGAEDLTVFSPSFGYRRGVHELGHAAFGLADEYEYLQSCDVAEPDQYEYTEGEPVEPNVTIDASLANPKWGALVSPATAIPTTTNPDPTQCHVPDPATLPPAGTIGFFDGAYYHHHGVYRPAFDCMMRDEAFDFCGVCQQAIRLRFYTGALFAPFCFVATAVYGDPAHPDVATLRAWRDRRLRPGAPGRTGMRLLASAYQQVGPPLAAVTRRHPRLAAALRRGVFAPAAALLRRRAARQRAQR
jgi:hypothetical protein